MYRLGMTYRKLISRDPIGPARSYGRQNGRGACLLTLSERRKKIRYRVGNARVTINCPICNLIATGVFAARSHPVPLWEGVFSWLR